MAKESLPGSPTSNLIRRVRKTLRVYLHCRPQQQDREWRLAWEWAYRIARRAAWSNRLRWPRPNEIATQFLALKLAHMKASSVLRMPYGAVEHAPALCLEVLPTVKAPARIGLEASE